MCVCVCVCFEICMKILMNKAMYWLYKLQVFSEKLNKGQNLALKHKCARLST